MIPGYEACGPLVCVFGAMEVCQTWAVAAHIPYANGLGWLWSTWVTTSILGLELGYRQADTLCLCPVAIVGLPTLLTVLSFARELVVVTEVWWDTGLLNTFFWGVWRECR